MVIGRALAVTTCATCRLSLLNNFISLAGPSVRASEPLFSSTLRGAISIRHNRYSSHLTNDDRETVSKIRGKEGNEDNNLNVDGRPIHELTASEETTGQTSVSAKPWYLQVDAPQKPARPVPQHQELPELPEAPPPILRPLLQQLSIDLGLDDLSLLDLRKLDPPPALGANLIMLIGTARSEKHLHVSADRLCRWFRSNYKLRPNADGLLGRNELKLKLRRKAKRTKLLGGTEENADDGIRTGWVCVDVGIVQEAEGAVEIPPPQDFIGFGRRTEGARLVVQLLTEEKREEMELEKLWNGILKRGAQREIEDIDASSAVEKSTPLDIASNNPTFNDPARGFSGVGQVRGFHTFARHLQVEDRTFSEKRLPVRQPAMIPIKDFDIEEIREGILLLLNSDDYERVKDVVSECKEQIPPLQGEKWRGFLLDIMKQYLQSVPRDQARVLLGIDDADCESTEFLKLFYETMAVRFTSFTAEMKIWLLYYGREIEHPGYNNERLLELFRELQRVGVKLTRSSCMYLLRSILLPYKKNDNFHGPSLEATERASQVLHTMHDQGLEVLTEDMFVTLQELTSPSDKPQNFSSGSVFKSDDTFGLPSFPMPPIQKRIHVLMKSVDLPLFKDESRIKLMDLYARNNHWQEFWEIFRMAPQHNKPQSAAIYAFMFAIVAFNKNQTACMTVLRNWIPELKQELPSIELQGEVGMAVKRCLEVAEPCIEEDAEDPSKANNEFVMIWQQCK